MARLIGGMGNGMSGKIGGVVYVQQYGETYARSAPQRSKNSWSPRQQLHRLRFKAVHDYCAKYKYTLIPQIWNLASEHGHGYNLFLKANMPAFALDGQLADIEKLHFSDGKLPLPQRLMANKSETDPSKAEVSWLNDENLSPIYKHDEFVMIVAYPDHFSQQTATGIKRMAGNAVIQLPSDYEDITGIYLYFAAPKKNAFSPDQFFRF